LTRRAASRLALHAADALCGRSFLRLSSFLRVISLSVTIKSIWSFLFHPKPSTTGFGIVIRRLFPVFPRVTRNMTGTDKLQF